MQLGKQIAGPSVGWMVDGLGNSFPQKSIVACAGQVWSGGTKVPSIYQRERTAANQYQSLSVSGCPHSCGKLKLIKFNIYIKLDY